MTETQGSYAASMLIAHALVSSVPGSSLTAAYDMPDNFGTTQAALEMAMDAGTIRVSLEEGAVARGACLKRRNGKCARLLHSYP